MQFTEHAVDFGFVHAVARPIDDLERLRPASPRFGEALEPHQRLRPPALNQGMKSSAPPSRQALSAGVSLA